MPKGKPEKVTKEEVQQLLDRYANPANRKQRENWPQLREALEEAARAYGLEIPWPPHTKGGQ